MKCQHCGDTKWIGGDECPDCAKNLAPEPAHSDADSVRVRRAGSENAAAEAVGEVMRATQKFPTWPTDPIHALAVLQEEVGELTKEVVQLTYEPHKSSLEAVRVEAIQTAAMALRFLVSLDRYTFLAGQQHSQNAELKSGTGAAQPKQA
jgi:hypothetical protein